MSEDKKVYAIYEGCVHEGGGVQEIYADEEKAIKFALMLVEEKNAKTMTMWENNRPFRETQIFKEDLASNYDFPIYFVKRWINHHNEIVVIPYELK